MSRFRSIECVAAVVTLGFAAMSAGIEQSPTSDALSKSLAGLVRSNANNALLAAEAMPAADYGFRPGKEARSFGELVGHLVDANRAFCSALHGSGTPFEPSSERAAREATSGKTELLQELRTSFDSCEAFLKVVKDDSLATLVALGGGRLIDGRALPTSKSPLGAMLSLFAAHTNLHYGNMATYLRIKGLIPPTSRNVSN